jgi:hypothetical protein
VRSVFRVTLGSRITIERPEKADLVFVRRPEGWVAEGDNRTYTDGVMGYMLLDIVDPPWDRMGR